MIFGWKAIDKRPFASVYWRSGEEKNWTNSFIGVAIMRTEKQRNEKKTARMEYKERQHDSKHRNIENNIPSMHNAIVCLCLYRNVYI